VAATSSGRHRHGSLNALPPRSQPALDQHSSTRWAAAMRGLDPRGRTRADNVPVRADASVTQIWWTDASGRTRRSGCVASLGRAHATRRSGRTSSDACGPDASARWRCPKTSTFWARSKYFTNATWACMPFQKLKLDH
jgi:hypothetical protein